MSYRRCNDCKIVINNRIHQGHDNSCPYCGSHKMMCPIENNENWGEIYKHQTNHLLLQALGYTKYKKYKRKQK